MPKKNPTWFKPTSDVGFHKIFCTEGNDKLVLQLLNSIVDDKEIVSFTRLDPYHQINIDTHSTFDLYCQCSDGSRVVIECQNYTKRGRFIDRALVYSSLAIIDQAKKNWNYSFDKVYFIGILTYSQWPERPQPVTKVTLQTREDHLEVSDKLLQIFVELDKFGPEKGEDGAANRFLRAMRDIGNTQVRQEEYNDTSLDSLFDASRYAHLNKDERMKYDNEMKFPPDYEEHAQYLAKKAAVEATVESKREVAGKMKALGVDSTIIAQGTGLTIEEVEAL